MVMRVPPPLPIDECYRLIRREDKWVIFHHEIIFIDDALRGEADAAAFLV